MEAACGENRVSLESSTRRGRRAGLPALKRLGEGTVVWAGGGYDVPRLVNVWHATGV